MSIHASLTHKTVYTYDRLTGMGPQVIRLRPAPHARTEIISYSLKIEPANHFINWQQDAFGNFLARIIFNEKVEKFSVTVDLVASMEAINPFDFFVVEEAKEFPFEYDEETKNDLAPYLEVSKPGKLLAKWLADYKKKIGEKPVNTIDFVVELNQALENDIDYMIRMEPGVQAPEETLKKSSGSCRDSGWLLVHIFRHLGLAARFVSGYLIQLKPDEKSLDGPSGAEEDFTDLHAWTEVYLPGAGWVGLDPTSGLLAGEGHIPLAATPQPTSAAPISGAHDEAEVEFDFAMNVQRLLETPRVTKPYTEEQWQDILTTGDRIDERLKAGDVRLTMGGEPTFVSIDDYEGDEWNTGAVGPTKRQYAEKLIRRLKERFAPGGLLHFGQGKWYPGEQLPRWSFSLYWRRDQEPLWLDDKLVDQEIPKAEVSHETAQKFMHTLADNLKIDHECVLPAYEDEAYFLLMEQKLPVNVDTKDNKLEDPSERQRLMNVYDKGVTKPAGYVLPIQVWHSQEKGRAWVSEIWELRRKKLFLNPGDSPAGFRLPLNSLAWVPENRQNPVIPLDPFAAHAALPAREALLRDRRGVRLEDPAPIPEHAKAADEISASIRTALSIEPRDGHLCVFMPPLIDAEDYAALSAAVELTAQSLDQPIHIEGYEPPSDPRLNVIKVTPDPGVIEVNIHPATSWQDTCSITTALYEEAKQTRLGTEKFMLDGRHTGTGGGNHIVLGGANPNDSPFIRRPDLLASLIAYWQNHPSLSYLFSGMFIGPTSQAPRVDEARHESLYELEIALKQVPDPTEGYMEPWLVDRIFRNLLIDVTGNTHRTEICIDKLYSPDSTTGRLGLVEFRSFEMPPHARMSLAQQLLIRTIIARLWEHPYNKKLTRWGTALHDKFMLPHFVWQDFTDVLADLRQNDMELQTAWFDPHFEFRFPTYGKVNYDGVEIELRQALEPWHVLGEEGAVGGTARYVDSSLERLQIKVSGLNPERHVVTCNQITVPLTPTNRADEHVAGIRYRAWQPPSCLQPTIGVHTPLTIELFDTWNNRALGGCKYHVSHPGGKSHDAFPVNAFEAEGRRLSRFEPLGHNAGTYKPLPPETNPDFPSTLDLRRY